MEKLLIFIRGVVRPTLTWIGFITLTTVVLYRAIQMGELPADGYVSLVALMVGFWFAERKKSQ